MEFLKIKGGKPLEGKVKAAGAKNAVTKLLVASVLSDKKTTFYNVPNINEVQVTIDLCKEIGAEVHWDREGGIIEIVTKELKTTRIPQHFSGANRIPILMLGALLGRSNQPIIVPTVGGCTIGKRPVDFHIEALRKLGAEVEFMASENAYCGCAVSGMKGAVVTLPYPSVGATENAILGSVRAKGLTVIKNAATEPEIIDLILFLQKLGVTIEVDVDRTIRIFETKQFHEVEHVVITDRIEAASLGLAGISTKGRVLVEGAQHAHMITFLNRLREVNAGFEVKKEGIEFFYKGPLKGGLHIETDVHPGFMTDWQQPFVVLLTQAQGASVVHETVYENRFGYAETLRLMGADISLFNQCLGGKECRFASQNFCHSIVVKGPTPLQAKDIVIPDLRAGFAYVLAALLAPEVSHLSNIHYLDRGYENLDAKLTSLGAEVSRVPAPSPIKPLVEALRAPANS